MTLYFYNGTSTLLLVIIIKFGALEFQDFILRKAGCIYSFLNLFNFQNIKTELNNLFLFQRYSSSK